MELQDSGREGRGDVSPSSPRKRQKIVTKVGYCHLRAIGGSDSDCRLICLRSDRLYTFGRSSKQCDVVFDDCRVSRRHCQVIFDGLKRKVLIWDGCTLPSCVDLNEIRKRFQCCQRMADRGRVAASVNGLFVNGHRVKKKRVTEVCVGDEVTFVCGSMIGFVIERIVFTEEIFSNWKCGSEKCGSNEGIDVCEGVQGAGNLFLSKQKILPTNVEICGSENRGLIERGLFLLGRCRCILQSAEPVSFIKRRISLDKSTGIVFLEKKILCRSKNFKGQDLLQRMFSKSSMLSCQKNENGKSASVEQQLAQSSVEAPGNLLTEKVIGRQKASASEMKLKGYFYEMHKAIELTSPKESDCMSSHVKTLQEKGTAQNISEKLGSGNNLNNSQIHRREENSENKFSSLGKTFFLNRIDFIQDGPGVRHNSVSLPELFHPVKSISRVFIATFTSDISWFLSYCEVPNLLPVTIACHNSERCWSTCPDKRTCVPFLDYPNLVVVFPPFPEVIAFGKNRKKQGIACHHPKLLVLQRDDFIRIIITSANLVSKQWTNVTNTVWWQDFPRQGSPDFLSLFSEQREGSEDVSRSDFSAQLAGFMASLLVDVPSQADWITELTKYNFDGASVHLVASIPGIHVPKSPIPLDPVHFLSAKQIHLPLYQMRFLGTIQTSVVGLRYRFCGNADANGIQVKMLASLFGRCHQNNHGMSEVLLKRVTDIPADANAVSVLVCGPDESSEADCIQLGFLPKNIAKWVSPLCDPGFFSFSACIRPKEALAATSGGDGGKVQLIMYVSQGPNFSSIQKLMKPVHIAAICSLLSSLQRSVGLWRLQEVLSQYKWPQSQETDFVYGSSSIGTSVNADFLAAFAAAAGKKAIHYSESEESDPEWGLWDSSHERNCPSMGILFPTIERVKSGIFGVLSSRRLLSLSERTWQRLKMTNIFHDSVPNPSERVGYPMHVKVARRRFQSSTGLSSIGWVYCGSHNFSAAAWGQPITNPSDNNAPATVGASVLGFNLLIRNYELGVLFVVPPTNACSKANNKILNLDDIVLPFVVPALRYGPNDKPASAQSMREAWAELAEKSTVKGSIDDLMDMEIPVEDDEVAEVTDLVVEEDEEDKDYAKVLWSQVDSSGS